jgi:HK97 family phage prohead protease
MEPKRPPRDYLIRALRPGIELRSSGDGMPTMTGHFAVFNQWTRIDSIWEGEFMERIAPGSFAKTFKENRANMRVTLNHGSDPVAGDKPLGPITELREDSTGGYYEVPLLDTTYNRDILPGLQAGLYGASFRFRVMKEEFVDKPSRSDDNPDRLPERTIKEASVEEFGPVTFPAYAGATAGVRSLTDDYIVRQLMGDPDKLAQLMAHYRPNSTPLEPRQPRTPDGGSRNTAVIPVHRFQSQGDFVAWLKDRA